MTLTRGGKKGCSTIFYLLFCRFFYPKVFSFVWGQPRLVQDGAVRVPGVRRKEGSRRNGCDDGLRAAAGEQIRGGVVGVDNTYAVEELFVDLYTY